MAPIASVTDTALDSLGDSLPRLAAALGVLVVGLAVAWLLGRVVARALRAVGADELGRRWRLDEVLPRVGLGASLSGAIGRVVRIVVSLVVIFGVAPRLGFDALEPAVNDAILFLPRLIVAVVILVAGFVVARFVGERVDRAAVQMDLAGPLGALVQGLVIAVFALLAVAQIGVPAWILVVFLGLIVGAAALTATLAFGLGARDVARQVSAGRYVGAAFQVDQRITVDGITGRITSLGRSAVLLETDDGATLRLPNHLLLETVVRLHERPAASPPAEPST